MSKMKVIQLVAGIENPIDVKNPDPKQLDKLMIDLTITTQEVEMRMRNRILARRLGWVK